MHSRSEDPVAASDLGIRRGRSSGVTGHHRSWLRRKGSRFALGDGRSTPAAGFGLGGNKSFPNDVRVEEGHVTLPELPGIGFEGKANLIAVMRALAE